MPYHILFVDDDPLVLHGILRSIRPLSADWDLHMATNAFAALRILATQPFDALVTDLRMPGLDGGDLSYEARVRFPWMARIMLTGTSEGQDLARARGETEQLLKKPCTPVMLHGAIRLAIERRVRERAQAAERRIALSRPGADGAMGPGPDPIVILAVDDDLKHIELLRQALASARPDIRLEAVTHDAARRSIPDPVGDGQSATPSLAATAPVALPTAFAAAHLILLGIDPSDPQALRFMTRYGASSAPRIPIVVSSASMRESDVEAIVRNGSSAVVPKPWSAQRYADLATSLIAYADLAAATRGVGEEGT